MPKIQEREAKNTTILHKVQVAGSSDITLAQGSNTIVHGMLDFWRNKVTPDAVIITQLGSAGVTPAATTVQLVSVDNTNIVLEASAAVHVNLLCM